MAIQGYIGWLYLSAVVVVTIAFLFIFWNSKSKLEYESIKSRFSRIGIAWLLALFIAAGVFTLATVSLIRYPGLAAPLSETRQIVKIDAMQFGWIIEPKEIRAGTQVEFQVTSRDVNHGFGVVNSDGLLLFEVQAMPRYLNKTTYTFTAPGTYRIICLEYCGIAHHVMIAEFKVVP